ncbi:MAG: hypothetical protein EOM26_08075 [Alphaproteobacteria bacterium]|nr:hypothetical protein [Alphaproteobacteria bacterium]
MTDKDVLERGNIYFFYRPGVNEGSPEGKRDIQRFYMILRPDGARHYRLCIIGRKFLPDIEKHQRFWGFIDDIKDDADELADDLGASGREHPARPAGEGRYKLAARHRGLHLVWALSEPEHPGAAQKDLNIPPEAAYVLSVKNPETGSPKSAGLSGDRKADYPEELQDEFDDRRFADNPEMLDYAGAQFVLIGSRENPEEKYGMKLGDVDHDEVFHDLRIDPAAQPVKPLFEGRWA